MACPISPAASPKPIRPRYRTAARARSPIIFPPSPGSIPIASASPSRCPTERSTPRATPTLPQGKANDLIAVVGGLALYVVTVLWAHQWLIGVSPV